MMSLVSEGISEVRAWRLSGGVWDDGEFVGEPGFVLVSWRSELIGKLYQVYVNGIFAGVTSDEHQRRLAVSVGNSGSEPVRIEVFAVDAEDADTDHSGEIERCGYGSRVKLVFLCSQKLSADSKLLIFSNRGNGHYGIDYSESLNGEGDLIRRWWQDKSGFGMAVFGEGDFGYESSASRGFGLGAFGPGEFGYEADIIEWTSGELTAGKYCFAFGIYDRSGNMSNMQMTDLITLSPLACPAENVATERDDDSGEVVLKME